jgi:hypothetical protein
MLASKSNFTTVLLPSLKRRDIILWARVNRFPVLTLTNCHQLWCTFPFYSLVLVIPFNTTVASLDTRSTPQWNPHRDFLIQTQGLPRSAVSHPHISPHHSHPLRKLSIVLHTAQWSRRACEATSDSAKKTMRLARSLIFREVCPFGATINKTSTGCAKAISFFNPARPLWWNASLWGHKCYGNPYTQSNM